MTLRLQPLIALISIMIFLSCGNSKEKSREEKEMIKKQEEEQIKSKNEKAIISLNLKYNAISNWDSLDIYSYMLQEKFIEQKKLISFEGVIKDITKKDSMYYLKIHQDERWSILHQNFISFVKLNPTQFLKFKEEFQNYNSTINGCFIFKVSKINTSSPVVDIDFDSDEDIYPTLRYDLRETIFVIKGDLIDFYLY